MTTLLYGPRGESLKEDSGWAWPERLEEASEFDFEFGRPHSSGSQERLGYHSYDELSLREWTFEERRDYLARAHEQWERNPLAKGSIRLITSFVLGEGMSAVSHGAGIQDILDEYISSDYIQEFERDLFSALLIDGEVFVRFGEGAGRRRLYEMQPIAVQPWYVRWIQTDDENYLQRIAYRIIRRHWDGRWNSVPSYAGEDDVPADQVLHARINALPYELRGRSELFASMPWNTAYRRWLEDRARINRYKGYMYHLSMEGATPAQVTGKMSAMKKPPTPGSIYVSSSKEELKELGGNSDAGRVSEDGRAIKLMSAVGMSLPEYMTSDGQNANLASATAQQLPALAVFQAFRDLYLRGVWRPILRRLIAGKLGPDAMVRKVDDDGNPTDDGEMIEAEKSFTLAYPDLGEQDVKKLADALAFAMGEGLVSKRTASGKMGYNYSEEREWIDQENEAEAAAVMQGRSIRGNPLQQDGGDYGQANGGQAGIGNNPQAMPNVPRNALPA